MTNKYTNRLISETSPYLLQHAHNPVDWYPWGDEALSKAKAENKPILISIGYSTCHWCHVMERESFEDEQTAQLMNTLFVNIKVDREERPDLDHIYMEAVQTLTGSGGWPLNCFLLPDGRPFYGGTYFPPTAMHNRVSWTQVLQSISRSYEVKYDEIVEQAEKLSQYIKNSANKFIQIKREELESTNTFHPVQTNTIFHTLLDRADKTNGGFGGAPKFPNTMALQYLLEMAYFEKESKALAHVELTLQKMISGGIFDQLGGGFSRYTVDEAWLIPHFEKMLYDNALLSSLLSDAFQYSKNPLYASALTKTLNFIDREMTSKDQLFYSAFDADSEGVEGKFYVWQKAEIQQILGSEANEFIDYFGVTKAGNWEESNILNRINPTDQLYPIPKKLESSIQMLYNARSKRIPPGLDQKQLLDWNALMINAYLKAGITLSKPQWIDKGLLALNNLLKKCRNTGHFLYRNYTNGIAKQDAFLDDYSHLVSALLTAYSATYDSHWLQLAKDYEELIFEQFWDNEEELYFFSSRNQTDILMRKKEIFDGAIPSGNATMVLNLQLLFVYFGDRTYLDQAASMLAKMRSAMENYPSSFSRWAIGLLHIVYPVKEIAIVGKEAIKYANILRQNYQPNTVIMASETAQQQFPLLADRMPENGTAFYLCENFACLQPVYDFEEFTKLISK